MASRIDVVSGRRLGPRRTVVTLAIAGGVLALAARPVDWARGAVDAALLGAGASGAAQVRVDGATAAPGSGALALVVLAAAAAAALAGPAAVRLLGLVLALAGLGLVVLAGSVWLNPQGAVSAEGERQAGVSAVTVSDVGRGPGPPITGFAGGLVLIAGLAALWTAPAWARTSPRYERVPVAGSSLADNPLADNPLADNPLADNPSLWDALDRGEDPTGLDTGLDTSAGPDGPAADPAGDDLPE